MRAAHVDMIWQILECWKCHIIVVTWALVHCLICTHSPSGTSAPSGIVRQCTRAYVTTIKCTTLTPKIKGIPELTYHIYLCCLVSGIQ